MFAEERQEKILEMLKVNKRVSNTELIKKFGVSGTTIRIDLTELEQKGLLSRTHGGAILKEDPVYGEFVFDCRDLVRSGVLPVQFPSEKPGEMFCRGCRKYRTCFYLIVLYREIGDTDRRYNMAVFSCCVRGGRLSYDLPSDYAS